MKLLSIIIAIFSFISSSYSQDKSSFNFKLEIDKQIKLYVEIPSDHYLYANHLKLVDMYGDTITPLEITPSPSSFLDPLTLEKKKVYKESLCITIDRISTSKIFSLMYQGCSDLVCFPPQEKKFDVSNADLKENFTEAESDVIFLDNLNLELIAKEVGYLNPDEFIQFLDNSLNKDDNNSDFKDFIKKPEVFLKEKGFLISLIFILIGGLALNLTPCILPMIPINLAIIGAGVNGGSRKKGFLLGALYGAGIAGVYGLLGIITVVTGAQFGILNSNPWFNLIIAIIFLILALSMFDIFQIDFSKFQRDSNFSNKSKVSIIIGMGALSGLLAGACVAPVVIAVLILAINTNNLLLPFILGLGMALPWPLAGAGLTILPKPGKWMVGIKYLFGILIIIMSIYYASLSWSGFTNKFYSTDINIKHAHIINGSDISTFQNILTSKYAKEKLVIIDFWAEWCKSCKAMDNDTFSNPEVQNRLESFIFIKLIANNLDDENTLKILDWFDVKGLPTFVILKQK